MKKIYLVVFCTTVLVWGSYCIFSGARMVSDSWEYSGWADTLISMNLDVGHYLRSVEYMIPPVLYLGFVSAVAFAKIIFGSLWQEAIVAVNILSGAVVAMALADLVYSCTKSKIAAFFTGLSFVLSAESVFWSRFILSDTSYVMVNFLLFYLAVKYLLENGGRAAHYAWLIAAALLLNCVYRPTGLMMVPLAAFVFYLKSVKREIRWRFFFLWLAVFIVAFMFLHAMVIKDPSLWPCGFGRSYLEGHVLLEYQRGAIVNNRPYMCHNPPVDLVDYVLITLDKFAHYYYFVDKTFKNLHNAINSLYYLPIYALSVFGMIMASKKTTPAKLRTVVALAVIAITGFGLFHALTGIDYDWRFRLPVVPYFVFMSGLGLHFILKLSGGSKTR